MEAGSGALLSSWLGLSHLAAVYATGSLSFILLVFASWCVGEGGEVLGGHYDASVVGGLVIAWLNTAPEAIFFITALMSDNPQFAAGAVSGSSVTVSTVAVGACFVLGARARAASAAQSVSGSVSGSADVLKTGGGGHFLLQPAVKKQAMMLGASTMVTLGCVAAGFSVWIGFAGVLAYCWFLYWTITHKDENEGATEAGEAKRRDDVENGIVELDDSDGSASGDNIEEIADDIEPVWKGVAYLLVGGVLILVFSGPFIGAVVEIATALRVNPILLAFFLAPVASEAPEILESISLSRKGNQQNINIAYANLVGGTVTKTTLLVGIFCFFGVKRGFTWEPEYTQSFILVAIAAAAAAGVGVFPAKQTAAHGYGLFGLFVVAGFLQWQAATAYVDPPALV